MLLVDSQLVLPVMHIKLGIMKNVLWALDKKSDGLNYLKQKFPKLSDEKIKEGIFVGLQIVQLFEISGSHNGEYEDDGVLEYCPVTC
jgi:hypothetical protein